MFASQAPGVYYQRLDAIRQSFAGVRTDVAGFAGLASRGPIGTPVAIESWRQFEAHFGGFLRGAFLPCAVRAFFENGGRRCWVVRVASTAEATEARVTVADGDGYLWRIAASTPGTWGNELEVALVRRPLATATTDVAESRPQYATVSSVSGFVRGSLVRAAQVGSVEYRTVSVVDPERKRLYWIAPDEALALPGERPLPRGAIGESWALESVEYDLLVWRRGRLVDRLPGLSPSPAHPRAAVAVAAPIPPARAEQPPPYVVVESVEAVSPPGAAELDARHPLGSGRDGLTTLGVESFLAGVAALEPVGEISMISIPDVHVRPEPAPAAAPPRPPADPCATCPEPVRAAAAPRAIAEQARELMPGEIARVYAELVDMCERRGDCIALIDPPRAAAHDRDGVARAIREFRGLFDSDYAALYAPWLVIVDPLDASRQLSVPPSGHIAGSTARTDVESGPHRAAANLALAWAPALSLTLDDATHGLLNSDGINVLRSAPQRGVRAQGARTLSSDPSWRYLPVRRTLIAFRKSIEALLQWAVFEPNNDTTRHKVTAVIDAYLRGQWARGALAGVQREAAYYIDATGTAAERDLGQMVIRVGVAPTVPFEFVLLRVGRVDEVIMVDEEHPGGAR